MAEDEGLSRGDHARIRARQGPPVSQVVNDVQRAGDRDVFVQPDDGRYVVRGPKGREHIIESDGEVVTSIGRRSKTTHDKNLRNGERRPATAEEIARLKEMAVKGSPQ